MKKILIMLLVSVLCLAGCSPKKSSDSAAETGGSVSFWSAPATEKILQGYHKYDDLKGEPVIELSAAKGEYESAQIIMTAKDAVDGYTVSLSDLKTPDGTTFSKDDIAVYNQKYIKVAKNYEGNGAPTGMYPDCLLPFDKAVKYGENKIAKSENQGLYFTFDVDANQPAGTYVGSFSVKYGDKTQNIPVSLKIYDVTVSETVRTKSIFLNEWNFYSGELCSTQEMFNAYTDKLIEYRLAPNILVTDTHYSDEDIAYYTELAYGYLSNPRCSNISIPYATTYVNGEQCFNVGIFKKYVLSFVEKSIVENFDMMKKCVCYFGIIDEPQQNGIFERVKVVCTEFDAVKEELKAVVEEKYPDSELKNSIIKSIGDLKNVVTCSYSDNYAGYVDTFCPQIQHYDGDASRAYYDDQEEKWWYTCISPRTPYPTYHTEDTLLSARLMGWMQADYDVVGNLFWATDIYARYDGQNYVYIDDYYSAEATRFPNVNGDGYLFYPGKKYGMDRPLGSLRLEAIRDGLEEYELTHDLKEKFEEIIAENGLDYTFDEFMNGLVGDVYSGTVVTASDDSFANARDMLLNYAYLINSDCNFVLLSYDCDGSGNAESRYYVKDGYVLKENGAEISDVETTKNGKIYTLKKSLSNQTNIAKLTIEGDETFTFSQNLGGKVDVYAAAQLEGVVVAEDVTPVCESVAADEVSPDLSGSLLKVSVPATVSGKYQSFAVDGDLLSSIGPDTSKIVISVYYYNNEQSDLQLTVSGKFSKSSLYSDLTSVNLSPGLNLIEIPMGYINFDRKGNLDKLIVYLGGSEAKAGNTLYIGSLLIYGK